MIIALVNHDCRQQFPEDIKALAAKKRKNKSFMKKKRPVTLLTTIPPSEKKDNGKKYCKHYDLAPHNKKSCYSLIPANQCLVRIPAKSTYYKKT